MGLGWATLRERGGESVGEHDSTLPERGGGSSRKKTDRPWIVAVVVVHAFIAIIGAGSERDPPFSASNCVGGSKLKPRH